MLKTIYTATDLVKALCDVLGGYETESGKVLGVWDGVYIFPEAFPAPNSKDPRLPAGYAVVQCRNGVYGMESSSCGVDIYLSVKGSEVSSMRAADCVRWLRARIDELSHVLYQDTTFYGAIPASLNWQLPESASRPVWEASISITFELPSAAHDNKGFLV